MNRMSRRISRQHDFSTKSIHYDLDCIQSFSCSALSASEFSATCMPLQTVQQSDFESLCACSKPASDVDSVQGSFPCGDAANALCDVTRRRFRHRDAREVRRNKHVFHRPERMFWRQRLDLEDIEGGASDLATAKRLQQILLVDNRTARSVDELCAARQRGKHARIDCAPRCLGQGQHIHKNLDRNGARPDA